MRSDTTDNHDRTGIASMALLTDDALRAACRRLTAGILRRWTLIAIVEGAGFVASRDLSDPELVRCWRLARDTQNSVVIRGMLADDHVLRGLFSHPVVELDSRQGYRPSPSNHPQPRSPAPRAVSLAGAGRQTGLRTGHRPARTIAV